MSTIYEHSHYYHKGLLNQDSEIAAAPCVWNFSNWSEAIREIKTWPEYEPQPLHTLPNRAKQLYMGSLFVKDESRRFGTSLGSFKALGAPYAVYKILTDAVYSQTGICPTSAELRTGKYSNITHTITVCVATDGNQGRGLAYEAKIFGCRCVDYIHNHVSKGRADRMKELGAIVIRIDGEYEASVERAKEDARMNGWHFVGSTSWSDFDESIPQNVMNAYMVVVEEALDMIPAVEDITHVFVCGGVGSIAAAVFLGFYAHSTELGLLTGNRQLPRFVVVESAEADCLYQSAKKGEMVLPQKSLHTIMAGLACRGPSPAAWKVLDWLASDFIAVPDELAVAGMETLALPAEGDIPFVCGESSAASMGILQQTTVGETLRQKLGLRGGSQVVVFGLESTTDPAIYTELVGLTFEQVFEAQKYFQKC